MKAIIMRFFGCVFSLLVMALLFPDDMGVPAILWGALMLTILYVFLRPLSEAILLPLNLFLFGLASPFMDALYVLWTSAWVGGMAFNYWQCLLAAVLIGISFAPYSWWKQNYLLKHEI